MESSSTTQRGRTARRVVRAIAVLLLAIGALQTDSAQAQSDSSACTVCTDALICPEQEFRDFLCDMYCQSGPAWHECELWILGCGWADLGWYCGL